MIKEAQQSCHTGTAFYFSFNHNLKDIFCHLGNTLRCSTQHEHKQEISMEAPQINTEESECGTEQYTLND